MVSDDGRLVIPGQRAAELALDIHETHQYVRMKHYLDLGFAGDESLGEVKPGNAPSVVQQYYLYNMYGLCHYSLHVETSRSLEHDARAAQYLGSMGASKDNAPKSCLAFPYLLVCR